MRSTGEVMGVARDFPAAFAKAQAAAGAALPESGTAFITVTDGDKPGAVAIAQTRTSSTGSSAATSTSSSTRRPARARAPTVGRSAARPSPAGSRA
jgi:hypothetical protein